MEVIYVASTRVEAWRHEVHAGGLDRSGRQAGRTSDRQAGRQADRRPYDIVKLKNPVGQWVNASVGQASCK